MLRRLWLFTRIHAKNKFLAIPLIFLVASPAFGDPPIERDFLRLPDGRWVWLEKTDWEATTMKLGKGKKQGKNAVWSKEFKSNDDRSWAYAYFVHLKKGKLAVDLDGDGKPEVGVATYDLGLLMTGNILIFTIDKNQLKFVRKFGPYNMAADENVY